MAQQVHHAQTDDKGSHRVSTAELNKGKQYGTMRNQHSAARKQTDSRTSYMVSKVTALHMAGMATLSFAKELFMSASPH